MSDVTNAALLAIPSGRYSNGMTTLDSTTARAGRREWLGLAVLMIPVLLVAIDNTVLSFALPAISVDLRPSGPQLMWIVDVYPLMLAGLLVAMGSLGDRIGRRRLLLVGTVGFGLASLLAATAGTAEFLIAARALQGIFGATLMPSTLSMIRNLFHHQRDRRLAIATWAALFGGGAALGPIVGGWLLEHFAWGSIFLINLPLIAAFLPLALFLLRESRDPDPGPVDPVSIALSMGVMGPAVFALKRGATSGVDAIVITTAVLAVVCALAFVRRQQTRSHPMLDVTLLRNPVFTGAIGANMLSLMGLVGFLFFGAQLLQLDLGLGPLDSALVLLPGTAVSMAMGFLAVRLVERISVRILVPGSLVLTAAGYAIVAASGQPTVVTILAAFGVMGIGIGIAETLTNDLILASVPPNKAGAASAISETAYETGSVLGTAAIGTVLTATYSARLELPNAVAAADPAHVETLGSTLDFASRQPPAVAEELAVAARAAFDAGVQHASATAIVVVLLAALLTWRAFRVRPQPSSG